MKIDLGGNMDPAARTEKSWVAIDQIGRQKAIPEQVLGTSINVAQDKIEQARTLDEPGLNLSPFLGCDEQRDQIQPPGPIGALGVAINIVSHAVLTNDPTATLPPRCQFVPAQLLQ